MVTSKYDSMALQVHKKIRLKSGFIEFEIKKQPNLY